MSVLLLSFKNHVDKPCGYTKTMLLREKENCIDKLSFNDSERMTSRKIVGDIWHMANYLFQNLSFVLQKHVDKVFPSLVLENGNP